MLKNFNLGLIKTVREEGIKRELMREMNEAEAAKKKAEEQE